MRTLKFIVEGQNLRPDPKCNFDNLVPGSEGYIQCEFTFSTEWDGFTKVAGFYSPLGHELPPRCLLDGRRCMIPAEALERRSFKIRMLGKNGKAKLITNKIEIKQEGGSV